MSNPARQLFESRDMSAKVEQILHDMPMMHLAIRERSADAVGQAQTAAIEDHIVERLKKSFPDLPGKWPLV